MVALVALMMAGCGVGNRTGFDVPINPQAVEYAASTAIPVDTVMVSPRAGNVVFSHGVHMIFAEGCETCHPEPWGMKRSPTGTIEMEPMYEGESCGACHDGVTAFAATDCSGCHDVTTGTATLPDVKLPGGDFGPTNFSHSMHLMAGSKCEQCHPQPWGWAVSPPGTMQMTPMYNGESCGECHDGRAAFDAAECARCHDRDRATQAPAWTSDGEKIPRDIVWPGTEEYADVAFSHANHAVVGVDCSGCHLDLFARSISTTGTHLMAPMYAGQSCGACHDGETSFPATDCAACHEGASNPVEAAAVEPAEG